MHRLGAIASSGCLCLCAGDLPPVAVEIAEECGLGLFGVVLMRSSSPQDEVELAVKDESERLLVGMHVERWGPSSFGLVTIPRLHEFADGGLDKLLRFAVLGSVASPQFCRKALSIPSISADQFKSPLTPRQNECSDFWSRGLSVDSHSQVLLIRTFGLRVAHRGSPQRHSAAKPQPKLGISRAKAQRPQRDGLRPVIPRESEGTKKDFSLRSK